MTPKQQIRTSTRYDYNAWFKPISPGTRHPIVDQALKYADASDIENHEFFELAAGSREALRLWVGQELVVTGPFSQALLRLASVIPNVHMRSMVMVVIKGEHGAVSNGCAARSHPWLLNQLRESMQIGVEEIRPCAETIEFLDRLDDEVESAVTGLAATGIGNERLILTEYSAVKNSFAKCWGDAKYVEFLDANIDHDMRHSELLADVASALISSETDARLYYDAAVASVHSREHFYDRLAARARTLTR